MYMITIHAESVAKCYDKGHIQWTHCKLCKNNNIYREKQKNLSKQLKKQSWRHPAIKVDASQIQLIKFRN